MLSYSLFSLYKGSIYNALQLPVSVNMFQKSVFILDQLVNFAQAVQNNKKDYLA